MRKRERIMVATRRVLAGVCYFALAVIGIVASVVLYALLYSFT